VCVQKKLMNVSLSMSRNSPHLWTMDVNYHVNKSNFNIIILSMAVSPKVSSLQDSRLKFCMHFSSSTCECDSVHTMNKEDSWSKLSSMYFN